MSLPPLLRAFAWLIVVVVVGFGVAGVVTGADHPPGDATRPELTARADATVRERLAQLSDPLRALHADVTTLGRTGRAALVALTRQDLARLDRALATGDELLGRIDATAAVLRAGYEGMPYRADSGRVGDATAGRLRAIEGMLGRLRDVSSSWARLTAAVLPARSIGELLARHDREAFAAATEGTRARYAAAVARVRAALQLLDRVRRVRDTVAATADVAVLDQWLARYRAYDAALLRLYSLLQRSGGRVTDASQAAFAAVQRAQRELPRDTSALVVIMADLAQAPLEEAVIGIDRVRGDIGEAIAALN